MMILFMDSVLGEWVFSNQLLNECAFGLLNHVLTGVIFGFALLQTETQERAFKKKGGEVTPEKYGFERVVGMSLMPDI